MRKSNFSKINLGQMIFCLHCKVEGEQISVPLEDRGAVIINLASDNINLNIYMYIDVRTNSILIIVLLLELTRFTHHPIRIDSITRMKTSISSKAL